ncbi:MAG: DUF255 domain-containing protein [gamma proteobacterium symbiont of Bathyaustriella thionipta]|nr:DUF255 domain-containing protein [gamma proteobacterium symbiont of Bathyaustriella thionipta]
MIRLYSALLLLLLAAPATAGLSNQLAQHASPYLAMHGNDPVAWQDWGPEVLEKARSENRPIFISSGYFACHWCHVMQRESYSDPRIAALLNQNFIPVKIDRELQTALDDYLIGFVQKTRGSAGWPLNVFLTPQGHPFIGFTYMPEERFEKVLQQLADLWSNPQQQKELLLKARLAALGEESPDTTELHAMPDPQDLATHLREQALALGNSLSGGFGQQSKFPMAAQLLALLKLQKNYPDEELKSFLRLTLDQMATQGLRDHLGGGFFRYTIDPDWQTPHYEKMLYTQALLVQVYWRAAGILKEPAYADVAMQTLDFTLKAFAHPEGGYITSFSAVDDAGVEGGYYLWSNQQLAALLNKEQLAFVAEHWGMAGAAPHEAGHLPIVTGSLQEMANKHSVSLQSLQQQRQQIAAILLAARKQRSLPQDDKRLAGWNALFLSALQEVAQTTAGKKYRQAAQALSHFMQRHFIVAEDLVRARHKGQTLADASLEDYAYTIAAFSHSTDAPGKALAQQLAKAGLQRFRSASGWIWDDRILLAGAQKPLPVMADGALPSPSAVLLRSLIESGLSHSPALAVALSDSVPAVIENTFWNASHAILLIQLAKQAQAAKASAAKK